MVSGSFDGEKLLGIFEFEPEEEVGGRVGVRFAELPGVDLIPNSFSPFFSGPPKVSARDFLVC